MGVLFESVQPGDLIASDLFNRLLAEFDKLRNRVAVLEGTPSVGDVAILRLVPDSGAVRPGDFLQVLGYGFGLSLGACRAFIDGVEIAQFQPGSNDGQLILIVPDGVGVALPIPPAGRPGALVVRGPKGTARRDLTLLPPKGTAAGSVELKFKDITPTKIEVAKGARFRFGVRSLVPAPATVVLTASFSGVANAAAWLATASFTQSDGTLLTGGRLELKAGDVDHEFVLALAAVPAAATGAVVTYSVNASSDDGLVTGNTGLLSLTVGQQPPTDPNIEQPAITNVLPPLTVGVLTLKPSGTAFVVLTATVKTPGVYLTPDPAFTGNDWTAVRTSPARVEVAAGTVPLALTLGYTIKTGGAPGDGSVVFTVQREGGLAGPPTRIQLKGGG